MMPCTEVGLLSRGHNVRSSGGDLLVAFSIIAIALAAITVIINFLPVLTLAALVLLAVLSSFLEGRVPP